MEMNFDVEISLFAGFGDHIQDLFIVVFFGKEYGVPRVIAIAVDEFLGNRRISLAPLFHERPGGLPRTTSVKRLKMIHEGEVNVNRPFRATGSQPPESIEHIGPNPNV